MKIFTYITAAVIISIQFLVAEETQLKVKATVLEFSTDQNYELPKLASEQKQSILSLKDSDLVSMPSLIVRSGEEASIEVIKEFITESGKAIPLGLIFKISPKFSNGNLSFKAEFHRNSFKAFSNQEDQQGPIFEKIVAYDLFDSAKTNNALFSISLGTHSNITHISDTNIFGKETNKQTIATERQLQLLLEIQTVDSEGKPMNK